LNYNAGLLTPPDPAPQDGSARECDPFVCFYAIGHSYRTAFEEAPDLVSASKRRPSIGLLPVAYQATTLADVFLGVGNETWGKVYTDCTIKPELAFRSSLPEHSPSLPAYLACLTPRWAPARTDKYDI
jgi:hypothetical protein